MTTNEIGREAVLGALKERAPRAMHLMEVVGALSVPPSRRDEVRDVLSELTGLGMAKELPGNRFRIGQKARPSGRASGPAPVEAAPRRRTQGEPARRDSREGGDEVAGWLSIHPRGFAFVAAEDGEGDVFIPPSGRANALHGDRVRVRARPSARGREGEVVEVIRRGVSRVAGVLVKQRKAAWLDTSDPRMPARIEVVGTIPLGVESGDEVVAAIETWPDFDGDHMEARVLSALGRKGSAQVEIEKIKIREGIEEEFPEEVLREAQVFGTRVPSSEIERREDLRDLDLCTIDPPTARDHDDAVWAERRKGGGFRIIVAIADVSFYVRPGSAIDEAALERATSIYLPDRVIPMLPHELSSNLASLVPDEDRLTLAVEVMLDSKGAIEDYRFIEGVMRSRARLFYGGAAHALGLVEGDEHAQPEAESRRELLTVLWDASQALRAKRKKRGSLDFDLPEAEILLGDDGEPVDIRRSRTDPGMKKAYGMIEDLMLLANEVVAADLSRRGLPAIYRIHGRPNEAKIEVFRELAESLGYKMEDDAGEHPKKLADFLARIESTTHSQALSSLLLRAMQQATYDITNIGHFALAATDYLHFTSPIRRYPDLAVHRVVRALIQSERVDKRKLADILRVQAALSSRLERRAMLVDREATNLYRALLMKDRIGESFEGIITGVGEHGLYVAFDEPYVEARCPVDTLGDDWYELDSLGLRLVGKRSGHTFAVGDRLSVRLENVSIEQRELTVRVERGADEAERPSSYSQGSRGSDRGDGRRGDKRRGQGTSRDERRPSRNESGARAGAPSASGQGRGAKSGPKKTGGKKAPGSSRAGASTSGAKAAGSTRTGAGKSAAGKSSAGKSSADKSSAGKSSAGKSSAGKSSAGKSSAGRSSAGKSSPAAKAGASRSSAQSGASQSSAKSGRGSLSGTTPKRSRRSTQNGTPD